MAESFLSPKTFFRDLLVNFISGLAGGAIVGIFSGRLWLGLLSFVAILVVIFFFWLWNKYQRMIKLVLSGSAGYYYSFALEENPRVWREAKKSFCYLGISSDSIMEPFRRWIEKHHLPSYRILLMNPDSSSLKKQEAFEKGNGLEVDLEKLPSEVKKNLDEAVDATRKRIQGAISLLKGTAPFKQGRMRIRLYDEFTPWWVYLIDDQKAYIGILEKGRRGSESPVIIMGKNDLYTTPFDAFRTNWERIWENAKDA